MGVLRLGYIHVRVTDLDEALKHYGESMGLLPQLQVDRTAYLKGWDEWEHHSLVLKEGGVGVEKFGFRVEKAEDLDDFERRAQNYGVRVERMSTGDNAEVSDGLRCFLPSGHIIELYHNMTFVDSEVGFRNPYVLPRHLQGMGVPRLDHALMVAEDVNADEDFFVNVLDFFQVERVVPSFEDTTQSLATWLSVGNRGHDIAILGGPPGSNGKLHHFAFQLQNWGEILKAADIMTLDDIPIDLGPTRHGITRGQTIYYFDPAGNRNEVFADGYVASRDRPCTLWSADQLGRGIFYHDRQLNDAFTTVFT